MSSYTETLRRARRLALLQALQNAARYRAATPLLRSYCEAVGVPTLTVDLDYDLAWLQQLGLVVVHSDEGATSATLTTQGLDVATGHAVVDGVERPAPR